MFSDPRSFVLICTRQFNTPLCCHGNMFCTQCLVGIEVKPAILDTNDILKGCNYTPFQYCKLKGVLIFMSVLIEQSNCTPRCSRKVSVAGLPWLKHFLRLLLQKGVLIFMSVLIEQCSLQMGSHWLSLETHRSVQFPSESYTSLQLMKMDLFSSLRQTLNPHVLLHSDSPSGHTEGAPR